MIDLLKSGSISSPYMDDKNLVADNCSKCFAESDRSELFQWGVSDRLIGVNELGEMGEMRWLQRLTKPASNTGNPAQMFNYQVRRALSRRSTEKGLQLLRHVS